MVYYNCLLIKHAFFQCPVCIRKVYASPASTLQTSYLEKMERYDREKEGLKHI